MAVIERGVGCLPRVELHDTIGHAHLGWKTRDENDNNFTTRAPVFSSHEETSGVITCEYAKPNKVIRQPS